MLVLRQFLLEWLETREVWNNHTSLFGPNAGWLNLTEPRTVTCFSRGTVQKMDGAQCLCVFVNVCCRWGETAERVTISHEQVSDREKHQIREQVLTQPVVIDPSSTGHPEDYWSEAHLLSLVITTRSSDTQKEGKKQQRKTKQKPEQRGR